MDVSVIEMVGMVGAGKTTLANELAPLLEQRGWSVLSRLDAIVTCMQRSRFGSSTRIVQSEHRRRRANIVLYKVVVRPVFSLLFAASHLSSVRHAVRSRGMRSIPGWHRRRVLTLFFSTAAITRFVGPRLHDNEVLLLDEGLIHRAVNLFGWDPAGVTHAEVAGFLDGLCPPDLVILVHAPLPVCLDRARSRGLPNRLADKDDVTIERFLTNAAAVIDIVRSRLEGSSRPTIVVNNEGTLDDARRTMMRGLDEHLVRRSAREHLSATGGHARDREPPPHFNAALADEVVRAATTPVFDPPPLLIPRPSRATNRRHREEMGADVFRAIGDWLDVPISKRPGDLGSSRGENALGVAPRGPVLVKRYKGTVSAQMIEHEHSVLAHLEQAGFPAPRLLRAPDGSTALDHAGRWHAVFEYVEGGIHLHRYLWAPRTLRCLVSDSGKALGSLHQTLQGLTPSGTSPDGFTGQTGDRVRGLDWHLALLDDSNADPPTVRKASVEALAASARCVRQALIDVDTTLADASLLRQVIHGDYGPYNVLLVAGAPMVILDYELSRLDWRITDVAKSFQQFVVGRTGLRWHRLHAFMDGYRRTCHLPSEEARHIPAVWEFLTLRRFIVCWHRFCTTGDPRWLQQAERRHSLWNLINSSTDALTDACVSR